MANMYVYTFIYILYIQLKSQHIFIHYKMFIILYNLYNYTICFKVMDWMNMYLVVLFEIRLYFYRWLNSHFSTSEKNRRGWTYGWPTWIWRICMGRPLSFRKSLKEPSNRMNHSMSTSNSSTSTSSQENWRLVVCHC